MRISIAICSAAGFVVLSSAVGWGQIGFDASISTDFDGRGTGGSFTIHFPDFHSSSSLGHDSKYDRSGSFSHGGVATSSRCMIY
jgi:hypothetical protein